MEDTGGFRTFVSKDPGSNSLALRGETIVDEHIGRLYTAFLNTSSTLDWVRFLVEVEELPVAIGGGGGGAGDNAHATGKHSRSGGDGGVLFQRYDMPWPVKDREVVLRRSVRLDKRAKKMIATCEREMWGRGGKIGKRARALKRKRQWARDVEY